MSRLASIFCLLPGLLLVGFAAPARACDGRLADDASILGGPVCVPAAPQRIVVLDPTYSLGMAIELDLPVIGAPLFGMSDETLKAQALARNVEDLGAFTEPSVEKVIALGPDLIIGSALAGEGVLQLASQIAPTVLIGAQNWKDYYRIVARITGTERAAEEKLAAYEARASSLRDRVQAKTVSVVRITPWDFQVYLDGPNAYGPFAVLAEAGVRRSAYETTADQLELKRPDWEQMARLDGDILLYIIGGANDSATSGRHEEVTGNPLWQLLPAVRSGNVHRVDAATWMEFSGLASANRVLDDVERYVIGTR